LGCSVLTDMLQERLLWMGGWRNLLEDGFKWLGIVAWSGHFILLALRFTRARIGTAHDPVLLAVPAAISGAPGRTIARTGAVDRPQNPQPTIT